MFAVLTAISIGFSTTVSLAAPIAVDSRIKTLIYSPNEVFELKVNHKYQSYVEFSKNERIQSIAVGDSSSWKIVPTGNKIFIRPIEDSARTNMMIVTNKFSYTFDLVALEAIDSSDMTYIIRFYYPDEKDPFDKDTSYIELLEDKVIKNKHQPMTKQKSINHNYSTSGDKELIPLDLFDNGNLTFFKFTDIVPKIFIVKENGSEHATEMLSFEGLTIINGVYEKISLRYQDKKLNIIKEKA